MSVWLRSGRDSIRLELLERWGRPPVVSPHSGTLRSRVRDVAGLESNGMRVGRPAIEAAAERDPEFAMRRDAIAQAREIALAVPDATRRGPWQDLLAAGFDWIEHLTPQAVRRTVLVATGVHAPSAPEGVRHRAGWSTAINGDAGYDRHINVGTTSSGTSVRLHPAWVNADARFVLSDLSFHYFAGFGGGRKLVFPGLGEPAGILANHRRCLTDDGVFHPLCRSGILDGNPVHEDLAEAASFAPPDILIQAFAPIPGRGLRIEAGHWRSVHEAGCAAFLRGHRLEHTLRPTILLADAGGAPRDSTLLQAHKSLQHASRFLPDGGRLLLVASLDEGSGSETFERLWGLNLSDLRRRAVDSYELHTHTALAMRMVSSRVRVGILSKMDGERLRPAGIAPFASVEGALEWLEEDGAPRAWGWIARAEEVLPHWIGADPGEGELP